MGLSSMHVSRPDRRDRLLLISALAIAVLSLLGAAGERIGYQPVAKVADPAWPRRDRARTLNGHGDGQETGGAPSVADVGGHGGPSDE